MHTIGEGRISTFEDAVVAGQYWTHEKARETLAYQVVRALIGAIERASGVSVITYDAWYGHRMWRFKQALRRLGFTLEEVNERCQSKGFDFRFTPMEVQYPPIEGSVKVKNLAEVLIELANEKEASAEGTPRPDQS